MYYVYVLQSLKDGNMYTGFTTDLENRLKQHNAGKVNSTKSRIPLKLIYYEVCLNQKDALHRERYLKTAYGKRYLKSRLRNYLPREVACCTSWGRFNSICEEEK